MTAETSPHSVEQLNQALQDFLNSLEPEENAQSFQIAAALLVGGFIELTYQDNRGQTLALRAGDRTIGTFVMNSERTMGLQKIRDVDTIERQPQSSQTLAQAVNWILREIKDGKTETLKFVLQTQDSTPSSAAT